MSLRETINRNPLLAGSAVAVLAAIGVGYTLMSLASGGQPAGGDQPTVRQAFYTVDNGKSFFADEINKPVPFEKDSRQAVRAHVFSCDGGKTRFVGYIERYPEKVRKAIEKLSTELRTDEAINAATIETGTEVRRPEPASGATAEWTRRESAQYRAITAVKCPDGQTTPQPVLP